MIDRLRQFFGLETANTTLRTEVLAGLATYLSLSYIFAVNPAILSNARMNPQAVLFATIVTSAVATIAMALWARLPFALAPGMEINAYIAFYVVGSLGYSWQQAMGAVFWSGIFFLILTFTGIRRRIIEAIPESMKEGLSACVGVFLCLIALRVAGLLRYDGLQIAGVGEFSSATAIVFYVGVVSLLVLERFRIKTAVLVCKIGRASCRERV